VNEVGGKLLVSRMLADFPSAGDGTRLGERRSELGHGLKPALAGIRDAQPQQVAECGHPGVIEHQERRQEAIVHEGERQSGRRVGLDRSPKVMGHV
jgi:hypothetical protein